MGTKGIMTSAILIISVFALTGWHDYNNAQNIDVNRNQPQFRSGDGTLNDPFEISNITELQNIKNHPTSHFVLVNDIDASETRYWNDGKGFEPLGKDPDYFTGTLNGLGHRINDLFISRSEEYVGLLSSLGTGSTMYPQSGSTVSNLFLRRCHVEGNGRVGGLAGLNRGNIQNCGVEGEVFGTDLDVGGLVGTNYKDPSLIENSFFIGNVTSTFNNIGGIAGINHGNIIRSYSISRVFDKGAYGYEMGGISSWNNGNIIECYSEGEIISNAPYEEIVNVVGEKIVSNNVGGLIGFNTGNIYDCYSKCFVTGKGYVGGLVGCNFESLPLIGIITNCYSTGHVEGRYEGGLVGYNNSVSPKSSFWDVNTSGQNESDGGEGKTTEEMMTKSTFTDAGWDFEEDWDIEEGETYPYFKWAVKEPITITSLDPVEETFQDENYYYDFNCTSEDDDQTYWFLNSNATWLNMDQSTGELQGTPTNDDVGWCWVNVSAYRGLQYFDTFSFKISVLNVNDIPVITSDPVLMATEDVSYSYNVIAIDEDISVTSEVLTFSLDDAPENMTINPDTGSINWIPTNWQADQEFTVIVNVTDGETFAIQEFEITVANVNDPPVIFASSPATNVLENDTYSEQFEAIDQDPTQDELVWSFESNASWLEIDYKTGELSGSPDDGDVGQFWVNITVSDGNGGTDSFNYSIAVLGKPEEQDRDGDGVPDTEDFFPDDLTEWDDSDEDGVGDNSDIFPSDPDEWDDSDNDTIGDNSDAFPTDPAASIDTDGDGLPDSWNDGFGPEDSTSDPPLVIDLYPDDPDNEATDDDDDDDDSTGDDDADDDDTGLSGSDGSNTGILLIVGLVAAIAIVAFLFFGKKKEPVGKLEESVDESED